VPLPLILLALVDGFDQRIGVLGAGLPQAAATQGWICCVGGSRHLHARSVWWARASSSCSASCHGQPTTTLAQPR
jgi:hypothetical protein